MLQIVTFFTLRIKIILSYIYAQYIYKGKLFFILYKLITYF